MAILSKVFILYTGGTIGMSKNAAGGLSPQPLDQLIQFVSGWDKFDSEKGLILDNGISLHFGAFEIALDSANVSPTDWLRMAQIIAAVYDQYDGFVILHGTDTMAYTASGLAFIFENLAKPIVLTGSQLPISHERTDAIMNLVNAVYIAGWKSTQLPLIPEVVICFADRILRACRSTKVSSSAWAGFDSPNYPHLGNIGEHIDIYQHLLRPLPDKPLTTVTHLETAVLDISLNPAMSVTQLTSMFAIDVKAIVLRTYGAGNAPDTPDFLALIADTIQSGKLIINVSQCRQGSVNMGLYQTSSDLLKLGVISATDMTIEATLSKLYYLLAHQSTAVLIDQMQVNLRGEQN